MCTKWYESLKMIMKTSKLVIAGLALAIGLSLVAIVTVGQSSDVGGNFNPVPVEFTKGITVGGTEVINSSGQFTGGLSTVLASSIGSTSVGLNYYKPVVTYTSDTTLTASQSGTIFAMGTAGLDLTLPAVASSNGVHYRFVVSAAYATTNMTVVSAEGDNIEGSLLVAGAVVDCDANDVITSVNDGENIGDYWDLYSNGTYWFIGSSGALTASKLTCSG